MVLTTLISDSVSDFDLCTLILVLTFKCFIQTYFFFLTYHIFLRFSLVNLIDLVFIF